MVRASAQHSGPFVVVQRGELPGRAGHENLGDADPLKVAGSIVSWPWSVRSPLVSKGIATAESRAAVWT